MTPAETKLWGRLRAHRLEGVHFRNQHAIGIYSENQPSPTIWPCNANSEWWDRQAFLSYYQKAYQRGANVCKLDCNEFLPKPLFIDGVECFDFRGHTWRLVPYKVVWQQGHLPQDSRRSSNLNCDLWHTWLKIQGREVHIDHISFNSGANQGGCQEYRVSMDGRAIARGGGYLGFCMTVFGWLRNLPMVITFD
jgi:hypothetical protein